MSDHPHYPWKEGDALFASELNAAIANAGSGGAFLPLTGGTVTGQAAFTGPTNNANGALYVASNYGVDPTARSVGMSSTAGVSLTADNAEDGLALSGTWNVQPNGHHLISHHNAGVWGVGASAGNTGTIDWLVGVGSHIYNIASNVTVVLGVNFLARSPNGVGTGSITQYGLALFQEPYADDGTQVTNAYGFSVAFKSGIGTDNTNFPTAMLDIYGKDNSNATRTLRVRNTTRDILNINNGGTVTFDGPQTILLMANLPTSAAGLAPGQIWRNGTVLNII